MCVCTFTLGLVLVRQVLRPRACHQLHVGGTVHLQAEGRGVTGDHGNRDGDGGVGAVLRAAGLYVELGASA